jgi:hypothetical protein
MSEICDMTFSELCMRVREDYGELLPEDSYDSPEALILAMEAMKTEEHLFGYKNGSGYYFKGNVLKARLLEYGYKVYPSAFTVAEASEALGIEKKKISDALNHYYENRLPYFSRLPKKLAYGACRYKIRKVGVVTLLKYRKRMSKKFDLNCTRKYPIKVDAYIGVTRYGKSIGMTLQDAYIKSGIRKPTKGDQ